MMTNDNSCANLGFNLQEPNGQISIFALPKLDTNQAYKYLGVHFTINLDWSIQIAELNKKINMTNAYLAKRCFTPDQTVRIINIVLMPALLYRLAIITVPDEQLKKWEKSIAWLDREYGGASLLKLSTEAAVEKALTLLHQGKQLMQD